MADKLVKIGKIELPPRERWGEPIPGEGTHCSNCEYLKDAEKMICGNEGFIAWEGPDKPAGLSKIPAKDPREYCSIWWELKPEEEPKEDTSEEFGGEYKYRRKS